MHKETIINRHLRNGMQIELIANFTDECPNMVYGNFKQVDHHEGGVTIQLQVPQDRAGISHWEPQHYTIAELASDYAKQGVDNPSKAAYESLQRECEADVCGTMLDVELIISFNGVSLAFDCIGTAYYEGSLEDEVREVACDHFNLRQLIRDAKAEAAQMGEQFLKASRLRV